MSQQTIADTSTAAFRVQSPALVSFSGGRTSGLMLRRILDAFGGTLPAGIHVVFFNTGAEVEATLTFVRECGLRWGVEIVWLEYRNEHLPHRSGDERVSDHCARVTFETACRGGEPFAAVIRTRNYLPNPVARYCTKELKLRLGRDWMLFRGYSEWRNVVGIRADESHRASVANSFRGDKVFPLIDAGVCLSDVTAFWASQPFDLGIHSDEGNCRLCFLKSRGKIVKSITHDPSAADWWIRQERAMALRGGMDTWRTDRPRYSELLLHSKGGPLFCDAADREIEDCHCTD